MTGPPRLRRLRRRLREAARDNQWLIPAVGAVTGWLLSLAIGTHGDTSSGWTICLPFFPWNQAMTPETATAQM